MTLKLLKKRLYTALSILICCLTAEGTRAQVSLTLLESNISSQSDQTITDVTYGSILAATNIQAKSTNASFAAIAGSTGSVVLNKVNIKPAQVGTINLSGTAAFFPLSQTPVTFYNGIGLIGRVSADFKIIMAGNAWTAGTYTTPLELSNVTPSTQALNLTVPDFITMSTNAPATTTMTTTLASYRTGGGLSATNAFTYYTTLPTLIKLKTGSTNFGFTTTTPKITDPVNSASLLSAILTLPATSIGSAVTLSTTDQQITSNTGIPITTNNLSSATAALSISPALLKANFIQAGTYTLPITYTMSKTATAFNSAKTATTSSSVQVVVPRLLEMVVSTNDVLFNINTVNIYKNGLTTAMPAIVLSSTVPYNVSVKASGNFTSATSATIPAGTITVEGTSAETGVSSIILSNASQTLISGAAPVIDRNLMLQYRISAAQAANLLGKTAGLYQNTITFTCTAP